MSKVGAIADMVVARHPSWAASVQNKAAISRGDIEFQLRWMMSCTRPTLCSRLQLQSLRSNCLVSRRWILGVRVGKWCSKMRQLALDRETFDYGGCGNYQHLEAFRCREHSNRSLVPNLHKIVVIVNLYSRRRNMRSLILSLDPITALHVFIPDLGYSDVN